MCKTLGFEEGFVFTFINILVVARDGALQRLAIDPDLFGKLLQGRCATNTAFVSLFS